jgi:membrane protease YdiL (CAAX protease family)
VLAAAGVLYARLKGIPNWAAVPLLVAFLVEYPFYLVLAFPALRERFSGPNLAWSLTSIALLPYLICCMGTTRFQWTGLIQLSALALVIALWYRVLPKHPATDLAFLALYPAVLLGGYFDAIYVPLYSGLRREVIFLGHFSLIVITILALMVGRRVRDTGFGFLPTGREWRIGALHYLIFILVGLPLALSLHALQWKHPAPLWSIVATFIGFLWVASLSEEFLTRGVLQQWIEDWTSSRTVALVAASVVFGLLHLGYAGRFPNWRWVAVATVLGWCCGHARNQAGGIRAGVVTHALAVATWRAFFS